jgi:hypothetical protein
LGEFLIFSVDRRISVKAGVEGIEKGGIKKG